LRHEQLVKKSGCDGGHSWGLCHHDRASCHHRIITLDQKCHHPDNRVVIICNHLLAMAKGNPLLSVRIPADLDDRLNNSVQETGGSRSEIAIAALTAYLMPNGSGELAALRRRVEALEKRLSV
jgi:hypothetical protein